MATYRPIKTVMVSASTDIWRILVVDDDKTMRIMLRSLLKKKGFSVAEADSGAAAFETLEQESFDAFDMVLSDYWMPGENGMELLKRISTIDPTLSIVLLTADEERTILESLIRNGGCDYLRKPVAAKALLASVETACKKTRQLRSLQTTARQANKLGQSQRSLIDRHLDLSCPNYEFFFTSQSQASGDFVSAIQIDQDKRVILASDSSGHELSSAFQSSYFHGLARGMLHQGASMKELLQLSNDLILKEWTGDSSIGHSLAACAIKFNQATNTLSYINAGFPRPMAAGLDGFADPIGGEIGHGPLGWFEEDYQAAKHPLPQGYLCLWTDGLSDLAENLRVDPLALGHRFLDETQNSDILLSKAADDIAVLRLSPTGQPNAAYPICSVQIPGDAIEDIDHWQSYFEQSLRTAISNTDNANFTDIIVCLREGLINALTHGCKRQADRKAAVHISLSETRDTLDLFISDPGSGHSFDVETHSKRAIDNLIPTHRGMIMMQAIPSKFESFNNGAQVKMRFELSQQNAALN
ncbi:MAG: response regulator [Verrucomicrobiota bacterium]